jgi:hypothetical protein
VRVVALRDAPQHEPRLLAPPGGLTPAAALLHAHIRSALA